MCTFLQNFTLAKCAETLSLIFDELVQTLQQNMLNICGLFNLCTIYYCPWKEKVSEPCGVLCRSKNVRSYANEIMTMGSKKRKRKIGKRPSEAPSLQSELNEIWSLTLVSETARMHHPISDLAACCKYKWRAVIWYKRLKKSSWVEIRESYFCLTLH